MKTEKRETRIITEATVTVRGDTSVGIPDWTMEVSHIDLDLGSVVDTESGVTAKSIADELTQALTQVAKVVTGERHASVFLHGYDDSSW